MTTNEIHSPAGLWIRVLAFILDAIVIGVPLAILGILAFGTTENYLANSISLLYYLIVPVIWYGYTVGKK